ncbi:hypothetical protein [Amycolatopsis sp. NPDC059657]|uniref:hypothetical protein n=1 Tax=Amycolatopsis sp. NPDC059657 TaxID=3346899 RepID=UPI00366CCBD5
MDDEYFGALDEDVQTQGWGKDSREDRTKLMEGLEGDMREGCETALNALERLRFSDIMFGGDEWYDKAQKDIVGVFHEFDDAEIENDAKDSLQGMINDLDKVWRTLQDDSRAELDQAEKRMEYWRGEAANTVKAYIKGLADAYTRVESKITVLEADVVAAREAIASAREDLCTLAKAFDEQAEQFVKDAKEAHDAKLYKVFAGAFAGAIAGLLTVATAGVAAPAGAAIFTAANGALVAGNAAGSAIGAAVGLIGEPSGKSGMEMYSNFMKSVGKIRDAAADAADTLADRIGNDMKDLPRIPPPPDVSPGDSFDPSKFETDRTSKETEKRVRDSNTDIAPDGRTHSGPMELGTLD